MEKRNKGIQRHDSLYPLSHHHHHALFLALKLKRIGTEKSELKYFWEKDGNQHFRDEEEIVLPVFAQISRLNNNPKLPKCY
ncbi:hypothetical protein [Salinibacillus xinjiangensis]|uniref:hypothetical protein n=1 Tax=Salinibacillus xinjiangensis TaxID=1229268 RepID=UPI001E50FB34|nr:hypothetical protein [Salinibacillus xinjiangensis]